MKETFRYLSKDAAKRGRREEQHERVETLAGIEFCSDLDGGNIANYRMDGGPGL